MRAPSYKALLTLTNVDGEEEQAKKLRQLLKGEVSPLDIPGMEEETRTWHHAPNEDSPYVILLACSHVMELYGVEWVENKRHPDKSFYYINTGDTYCPTICHRSGHGFFISAWGDIVEQWRE